MAVLWGPYFSGAEDSAGRIVGPLGAAAAGGLFLSFICGVSGCPPPPAHRHAGRGSTEAR